MSRDVFRLGEVSKALQLAGSAGGLSGVLQRETKFCMTGFGFLDGMISRSLHPLTDALRKCSVLLALKHEVKIRTHKNMATFH